MVELNNAVLKEALDLIPHQYRGPGGVAGIVKDGEIVATRAWGYSDLSKHNAMTAETRLPICSISKQFTCGVLLDKIDNLDRLNDRVKDFIPKFRGTFPTVKELCDNQSGLRDYWALSILQGARAEQTFGRSDALPLLAQMKTGHFEPGTSYSYCNGNFRMLSELIEAETGQSMEALYSEVIWGPAGMKTAVLNSDTRHPTDEVVGYEGNDVTGFFPVNNGIYWIGDAGISASLQDMLAYEIWIDNTREDATSLYQRLSEPPVFRDGTSASYGFGLAHQTVSGVKVTSHGGALRGFRAFRMHAAVERLSVVVMFNHEANVFGAAASILQAALGSEEPDLQPIPQGWDGQWICRETGLLARLKTGKLSGELNFATAPDRVVSGLGGHLEAEGLMLSIDGTTLIMRRDAENMLSTLDPLATNIATLDLEIAGRYEAEELEATMVIEVRDSGIYSWTEGMLGSGIMERLHPVGPDTLIMVTRRSMDAPAPGDWTLSLIRDVAGHVTGFRLGCWLARQIDYIKTA
ncbi:MAG: D-aminopeptidase [Rhodospirillaceae bacterium]|nr:D-aminopeptidase [Rhodospirillaceae bacterium]